MSQLFQRKRTEPIQFGGTRGLFQRKTTESVKLGETGEPQHKRDIPTLDEQPTPQPSQPPPPQPQPSQPPPPQPLQPPPQPPSRKRSRAEIEAYKSIVFHPLIFDDTPVADPVAAAELDKWRQVQEEKEANYRELVRLIIAGVW